MAVTISFQLVAGSETNGTVTFFNTSTAEYIFVPDQGFEGMASFEYESICDGESIGTTIQYVPVGETGGVNPIATSVSPYVVYTGNCLLNGEVKINAVASTIGTIKMYDKDGQVVSQKALTSGGLFSMDIPSSNVWDAFYLTLSEIDKIESRPSNIVTFCPKAPTLLKDSGCCC